MLAATPSREARARAYDAVFARDAAVCALAMVLTKDAHLVEGVRAGLRTLARHQAPNGQIPKFVQPETNDSDFWYVGCIDATLWWLIALDFWDRHSGIGGLADELRAEVSAALQWARCQEHPRLALLVQAEAADWADIMPRSGFVLYSNALWYYVKRLYALPGAELTHQHFNGLFQPFSAKMAEYRRLRLLTHYVRRGSRPGDLYLSFVNFSFWGDEGDVFGNLLAVLLGLAGDAGTQRILRALSAADIEAARPVRVTLQPIRRQSRLWRPYMERRRQNLEWQYHNGGCWPFVGGFWVMALAAAGQRERAHAALVRLARLNEEDDYAFTEWFDGRSGAPHGMRGQSWNAAAFLLAQYALSQRIF